MNVFIVKNTYFLNYNLKLYFSQNAKRSINETQEWKTLQRKHRQIAQKRGTWPLIKKKQQDSKIGPILLGVFLFVIVGSTLFQILNVTNQSGDDILIWSHFILF